MSALSPWFFLAAGAVVVPLYLHLFPRHRVRRVTFPALRYLRRTEREHARRIRLRQMLLLLLRITAVLLLAGAGARLYIHGRGTAHPPTALALVLDNSMSSGLVVADHTRLDELKALAQRTLEASTPDDRVWVIRAGEPWLELHPMGAAEARAVVRETRVSAARGDLSAALATAARLLRTSPLPDREIHLFSDLQASAFDGSAEPASPERRSRVPLLVARSGHAPRNHAVTAVSVGGGLAPLLGVPTQVAATLEATGTGDTTALPLRLVVDGRVRAVASALPGATASLAITLRGTGWIHGVVETDPDALSADDRRAFAFHVGAVPSVALEGPAPSFVREALEVLREGGRLTRTPTRAASVLIALEGRGMDRTRPGTPAVIVPPSDAALLPALNRRLAASGIPWRYRATAHEGESPLRAPRLPDALTDARIRAWYDLVPETAPSAPSSVLAEIATGEPWLAAGTSPRGRYLLLASALDQHATSLPVSAGMVRFLAWATGEWAQRGAGRPEVLAGQSLPAPARARRVRTPSGVVLDLDASRTVTATGAAGIYTFLSGDTVVAETAVNPPSSESDLTPLDDAMLAKRVPDMRVVVVPPRDWPETIFLRRQGPELWRPLLIALLLLLIAESVVAPSGRTAPDHAAAPRNVRHARV